MAEASWEGNEDILTDDGFHTPETDQWWEHETLWFWWFHPERRLGSWIYHYIRPNIGVAGGGVIVFDDTAWFHMEAPYYYSYSNQKLAEERDLSDFTFPGGSRVQTLEPLKRYRLSFADGDAIRYELQWDALMKPWVRVSGQLMARGSEGQEKPKPRHLDQFGRVTGEVVLHGEEIEVDCYAMRDRSWWHLRREAWKVGSGGGSYITAMANPDLAFFGAGKGGFLLQDGQRRPLVSGTRRRERDPDHGFVRKLVVEAKDSEGRTLEALGESVSRIAIPIPGVHGVCWQSLMRYTINGVEAWGDDQDAWPISLWSAMRRQQRGLPDARVAQLTVER